MQKLLNFLPRDSGRIHGADVVRGIAATSVIFFHVLYLSGIPPHETSLWWVGRFDFFVRLFFILSAFSISNAYINRINDIDSISIFYLKRFFRIAPLFYCLIAYGLISNIVTKSPLPGFFDILLSSSFLFSLIPGKQDSLVGGGWSIGIEWLFYAFFPVFIAVIRGWKSALFAWAVLCTLAIFSVRFLATAVGGELRTFGLLGFVAHAHYFVVGLLLALIYKNAKVIAIPKQLCGALFIAALAATGYSFKLQSPVPEELALSVMGFVMVYLSLSGFPQWLDNSITRWLGLVSYSIYLMQFPVIQILVRTGFYSYVQTAVGTGVLAFTLSAVATCLMVVLISAITHRFIEVPCQQMANRFYQNKPQQVQKFATLNVKTIQQ